MKKSITEVNFRHNHSPCGSSAGEYPSVMAGTPDTVRGYLGVTDNAHTVVSIPEKTGSYVE